MSATSKVTHRVSALLRRAIQVQSRHPSAAPFVQQQQNHHTLLVSSAPYNNRTTTAFTSTPTRASFSSSYSSSSTYKSEDVPPLPHMGGRPTDEEMAAEDAAAEAEPQESHMKDGLAIKMATSSFMGRRRFYKTVGVRPSLDEAGKHVQHYEVTLDGYPLKTPGTEKPYRLPTKGLALAVALEWDQQVTYKGIEPTYMPLTGMATIALDEIIFSRQSTIDRCLRYLATDTVCYCFPEEEDDLKLLRRQQKEWEPLLAWLKDEYGVHIAKPSHMLGVCHNTPETLKKVGLMLQEMDPFTLAAFLSLVLDLKSVITALAVVFRHVTIEEACQASALEETHQKAAWGSVDLYHELEETVLYSQAAAASSFLWLLAEEEVGGKRAKAALMPHQELRARVKARLRKEFPESTPK